MTPFSWGSMSTNHFGVPSHAQNNAQGGWLKVALRRKKRRKKNKKIKIKNVDHSAMAQSSGSSGRADAPAANTDVWVLLAKDQMFQSGRVKVGLSSVELHQKNRPRIISL